MSEYPEFFTVFSLSRCGSTALFRALNTHRNIRCLYEPQFISANGDPSAVEEMVEGFKEDYSGMKHVWDPYGHPFLEDHKYCLESLVGNYQMVMQMNVSILRSGGRIVFLRRKNQLQRLLSDLLGQQTRVWTPSFPDFPEVTMHSVIEDARNYEARVLKKHVKPLDVSVVEWCLDKLPRMEEELQTMISDGRCHQVAYEDMFNDTEETEVRMMRFREILEFIGYPSSDRWFDSEQVRSLLHPKAKLNNRATLSLIPNLENILKRFGGDDQELSGQS